MHFIAYVFSINGTFLPEHIGGFLSGGYFVLFAIYSGGDSVLVVIYSGGDFVLVAFQTGGCFVRVQDISSKTISSKSHFV